MTSSWPKIFQKPLITCPLPVMSCNDRVIWVMCPAGEGVIISDTWPATPSGANHCSQPVSPGIPVPVPWTHLARTATNGSVTLTLMKAVTWRVGDEIVIASTGHRYGEVLNSWMSKHELNLFTKMPYLWLIYPRFNVSCVWKNIFFMLQHFVIK